MEPNPRQASTALLLAKGITVPGHLPELDGSLSRSEAEVVNRLLCLHALAAVAYGLPREAALDWIKVESLEDGLEPTETQFLYDGTGNPQLYQSQVEAMYALAWALGHYPRMDLLADCDSRFVHRLPNLKVKEPSSAFRRDSKLRSGDEVLSMADLGYCLHWAMREAQVTGTLLRSNPSPLVVEQRRRAFEWLVGREDWTEVSLDT